ncbi:MAG TPA: glutaminyl-peptide cyclotransferase [Actinomycetota bacterium]|nr:glutaminyl-peptide cyclotransferase [Actinomycetota bacterium]
MASRRVWITRLTIMAAVLCWAGSSEPKPARAQEDPGYLLIDEFPHDPDAFTQGLDFRGTALFEGTGIEGASSLRRVDLETGEVLRKVDLADKHFGEGITVFGRRVFQLTWKSGKCFVYRVATFRRVKRFEYEGEGWGLTHNGRLLIMSDGSNIIRFRDPKTFDIVREIDVTDGDQPVSQLNELEWVNGEIFANVWQTDDVVRIDPKTGDVVDRIDLTALRQKEQAEGDPDVTNGIAYMKSEDRLFVTGKWWMHIYEIQLT